LKFEIEWVVKPVVFYYIEFDLIMIDDMFIFQPNRCFDIELALPKVKWSHCPRSKNDRSRRIFQYIFKSQPRYQTSKFNDIAFDLSDFVEHNSKHQSIVINLIIHEISTEYITIQ